jgi:hypothetical protein
MVLRQMVLTRRTITFAGSTNQRCRQATAGSPPALDDAGAPIDGDPGTTVDRPVDGTTAPPTATAEGAVLAPQPADPARLRSRQVS